MQHQCNKVQHFCNVDIDTRYRERVYYIQLSIL
nr:MAG TPA: hypothetical protein [Bacteriophage sp.]